MRFNPITFMFLLVLPLYGVVIDIPFEGKASGGELFLCDARQRNVKYISITTLPDESASSVVARLADAIVRSDDFFDSYGMSDEEIELQKSKFADGSTLHMPLSIKCFFAGTETGLGIPKPVTSISCSFDSTEDQINVHWELPASEKYNKIKLLFKWCEYSSGRPEYHIRNDWVSGNETHFNLRRVLFPDSPPINVDELDVWVIGYTDNNVPSNAAGIHYNYSEKSQEELFGIPFRNGVAPNWKAWGLQDSKEFIPGKEQVQVRKREVKAQTKKIGGFRIGMRPVEPVQNNILKSPSEKPFVQTLKTPKSGGNVGVYRKFLGLTPGHTYQLSARINTEEMETDNDWALSVHMAHNGQQKTSLNGKQLAGIEKLPDNKIGISSGKIAEFSPQNVTDGDYVERSGQITLPKGVDSITVWIRLKSDKETSGASIDWIKLTDLGKTG